jgi:hypothetical protein
MSLAIVGKFLAVALKLGKGSRDACLVAMSSVAQTMFEMCNSTLAEDVRKFKNEFATRISTRTQLEQAEAQKRIAEAADAANKVTSRAHEEELQRLERERLQLENATKRAALAQVEAQAREAHSRAAAAEFDVHLYEVLDEARQKRKTEAENEVIASFRQLNLEGGRIYFDSQNLKQLMEKTEQPKPDDSYKKLQNELKILIENSDHSSRRTKLPKELEKKFMAAWGFSPDRRKLSYKLYDKVRLILTKDERTIEGLDHCTFYSGAGDERIVVTQPYDLSSPQFERDFTLDKGLRPEVVNATDWAFYYPERADLFIIKFPSGYEKALAKILRAD